MSFSKGTYPPPDLGASYLHVHIPVTQKVPAGRWGRRRPPGLPCACRGTVLVIDPVARRVRPKRFGACLEVPGLLFIHQIHRQDGDVLLAKLVFAGLVAIAAAVDALVFFHPSRCAVVLQHSGPECYS